MSFLKPKVKATTAPTNQFASDIKNEYMPQTEVGNNSTNFIAKLLGVSENGDPAAAFDNYKKMAGYAPALRDMQRGVVGGAAAQGLLNSGSTQKALLKKGAELDQSTFSNFLQQLAGLSGLGLQAGNLVSGAGGQSTSFNQQPSTAGTIAQTIGGIASIFSDRRTKRNIVHLTDFEDGLGLYTFRYLDDDEMRIGVMADEVKAIRPWAMGPTVGGFQTVNYGAL